MEDIFLRCNGLRLNFICYGSRHGVLLISATDAICLPFIIYRQCEKYFGQLISAPALAPSFMHRPNGKYILKLRIDKICVKFDLE